jgi:hypothetical protein
VKKLYLTYCSPNKRLGVHTPDKLYISDRITRFIERCRLVGVNWAILSALYAFFFPDEEKKDYNVTFRTDKNCWLGIAVIRDQYKLSHLESKQHIHELVEKLKRQANERHVHQIVFYGPSPMMMKCYLGVLHYAFDECSQPHGWRDLIEHVKDHSRTIKVVHRLENIC